MKIISKFRDYYDCITAYGIDDTVFYKRLQKQFNIKKTTDYWGNELTNYQIYRTWMDKRELKRAKVEKIKLFSIGFCGKMYPMVQVEYLPTDGLYGSHYQDSRCFYHSDRLFNELERCQFFKDTPDRKRYKSKIYNYFNKTDKVSEKFFVEYNCPTFALRLFDNVEAVITTNPRLSDYYFESVIDPFSAYQRISGFISGVLGTKENELVQISDLSMRDKKGFNEWSFKKMKNKKRGRK